MSLNPKIRSTSPDNKSSERHIIANGGRHHVEINVKIRKAGTGGEDILATSTPRATPAGSLLNFRRGSWADILRRPSITNLETKESEDSSEYKFETAAKSKSHNVTNSKAKKNLESQTAAQTEFKDSNKDNMIKDYADTISQLYKLCSKLKDELTEANDAKKEIEMRLKSIIEEKDQIISSYNSSSSPPSPPPNHNSILDKGKEKILIASLQIDQKNKNKPLLDAFREIREDIRLELEEFRQKPASPLPNPDPTLEKLLQDINSNNMESISNMSSLDESDNSSFSTIGHNNDLDISSTQYLNLPSSS